MFRRLSVYFKEMYPIVPRFLLGLIIFGEIHFIILLNAGIRTFRLGFQELIGGFTVFSFLLWLRIADDFKDYELDSRLFTHRPLPSGRVHKRICCFCSSTDCSDCSSESVFYEQFRVLSFSIYLWNIDVSVVFQ